MTTLPAVAGDLAAEHVGAGLDELVPLDALEPLPGESSGHRLSPQGTVPAAYEDPPVRVGPGTNEFVPPGALEPLELEPWRPCVAISRTRALRGPWAAAVLVVLGAGALLLVRVERAAPPANAGPEAAAPMPRAVSGGRGRARSETVMAHPRRGSTAVRRPLKSRPRRSSAVRRHRQPLPRPSALPQSKPEALAYALPRTPPAQPVASPPACEFEPSCASTEASP